MIRRAAGWLCASALAALAACAGPRDASAPAGDPPVAARPPAPAPPDPPVAPSTPAPPAPAQRPRASEPPSETGAPQGEACPDGKCRPGLRCVRYYGVAGASGPEFSSCEIPCMRSDDCPPGQTCGVIVDGPGQVCRPKRS